MEESGEYSKLKQKLKRKTQDSKFKMSTKRCKLLQDYANKEGLTKESVKESPGYTENAKEGRASHSSKKKKKKDKATDYTSCKSQGDIDDVNKEHREVSSTVEGGKRMENKLIESVVKGDHNHSSLSVAEIKEKKREKRRQKKMKKLKQKAKEKARTEGGLEAGVGGSEPALDYLQKWKTHREDWSFQKVRQVWLLQHMYSNKLVSDGDFAILLEYLEGLQGKARCITVEKAESIVEQSEGLEDTGEKEREELLKRTERARQIVQILS